MLHINYVSVLQRLFRGYLKLGLFVYRVANWLEIGKQQLVSAF